MKTELDDARRDVHEAYIGLVEASYLGPTIEVVRWADTLQDAVDQLVEAWKHEVRPARTAEADAERAIDAG